MSSHILPRNVSVICLVVAVFWATSSTASPVIVAGAAARSQTAAAQPPADLPLGPTARAFQDSRPVVVSQDDLVKPGTGGPFMPPPPESSPAFYIKARPGQRIDVQPRFFDKPNVNLRGLG